jgi:hypothetical protein
MKLKDLIASDDFSAYTKERCGLYNYYGELSNTLYPDGYSISYEHDEEIRKSGVLTRIAIREWLCTDTHVGFYLYFVEDIPVVTMYQSGRKSYPEWNFLSTDSFALLKNFVDECMPKTQDSEFDIHILDEMDLHLDCSIDKVGTEITSKDFGLSAASNMPTKTIREAVMNFSEMNLIGRKHTVEWFTQTIKEHESFMQELKDPEDIKFAEDAARENLHEMKLFLEKCV